jgi:hypothetical protein
VPIRRGALLNRAAGLRKNAAVAEELTFTRFTELMLARTYEAEKASGANMMFSVHELMDDIAQQVDDQWPWQAAQYLSDAGLVEAAIGLGNAQVALTPQGRVFVEAEETDVIRDYRHSGQLVFVLGDGNQVAVGHGQTVEQASGSFSKEEALELLDEADERLESSSLSDAERSETLADVDTVRKQLQKQNPNRAVIRAVLPALRAVDTIADLADKLHHLIG